MELKKHFKATPDEVFDVIERSVLASIEEACGKQVSVKKLPGYRYKRTVEQKHRKVAMKIKIKQFERPRIYEAQFVSNEGTNHICYSLTERDNGDTDLVYTEEYTPKGSQGFISAAINGFIYNIEVRFKARDTLTYFKRRIEMDRMEKRKGAQSTAASSEDE